MIYALRRDRYEEVDPRFGHDLSFPYLMVKRGFRAVYAPRAVALEKMTTDLSDEFRRKVRMLRGTAGCSCCTGACSACAHWVRCIGSRS